MHTRVVAALSVVAVLLTFAQSWAQQTVRIEGSSYVEESAKWYVLDSRGERWEVQPGIVEIRFRSGTTAPQKEAVRESAALTRAAQRVGPRGFELHKYDASRNPVDVLQEIYQCDVVDRAYVSTRVKFFASATDTYYVQQWNLPHTGVDQAWDITTGSPDVTVGILDDGIDIGHEDLQANIWTNPGEVLGDGQDNDDDAAWYSTSMVDDMHGWDFVDDDNDPRPESNDRHGTPSASLVCATRNNGIGIAGVAGGNNGIGPRLVSLRIEHDGTVGSVPTLVENSLAHPSSVL